MAAPCLPCAVCGEEMTNVFTEAESQPHKGLMFTSSGNYGSTVFDPFDGSYLLVIICDDCITNLAREQKVYVSEKEVKTIFAPLKPYDPEYGTYRNHP